MRKSTLVGLADRRRVPLRLILILTAWPARRTASTRSQRVPAAGGGQITLADGGEQVIYAETDHVVGKSSYVTPAAYTLTASDGTITPAQTEQQNTTYNLDGHSGIQVATVTVPAAGTYTVAAAGPQPADGVVDIAVGEPVLSLTTFVLPLVLGILLVVGSLVGGILLIVLPRAADRRRRGAEGGTGGSTAASD